jgi:hypothetical protein
VLGLLDQHALQLAQGIFSLQAEVPFGIQQVIQGIGTYIT